MIKNFLLLLMLLTLACASKQLTQFSCDIPEGKEYVCYSDSECLEYMKGYSGLITHRFQMQDKHGWYPERVQTILINLWADHKQIQLLGKIEAERFTNNKIYVKVWTEAYDIECNLLDKGYDEGYRKPWQKVETLKERLPSS